MSTEPETVQREADAPPQPRELFVMRAGPLDLNLVMEPQADGLGFRLVAKARAGENRLSGSVEVYAPDPPACAAAPFGDFAAIFVENGGFDLLMGALQRAKDAALRMPAAASARERGARAQAHPSGPAGA
ncbi:MAG: hypothetical protein ACYCT1_08500 [Steroidobacteraceae bacterium]